MFKSNKQLLSLVFVLVLAVLSVGLMTFQSYQTDTRVFAEIPQSVTPIPTIIVFGPLNKQEMDSPDGTMSLTMESRKKGDMTSYLFFTTVKSQVENQTIFTKELTMPQQFSIPYNTWSPDNKFFFLKTNTPSRDDYFVFQSNGEDFSDGSHYLDVQDLFEQKVKNFVIEDVTGWAAPNLLLVNTKETEGDKKVSFWFDVYSRSFIRLGTYFR